MDDALRFVALVKETFASEPAKYQLFLTTLAVRQLSTQSYKQAMPLIPFFETFPALKLPSSLRFGSLIHLSLIYVCFCSQFVAI